MPKKIKLTAVIEADDNAVFDESAINNSVGKLGKVESYNIGIDTGESDNAVAAQEGADPRCRARDGR